MNKFLDCTLRDGGYYTNWDFNKELVLNYCKAMESLPVDYVEIGYRSITMDGYLGEYFYCPEYVMKELKLIMPSKKLVIILNEKDIRPEHVEKLLAPCKPYISMVRLAIDPKNFSRAIALAEAVKGMGFEVAFNVMYMSNWKKDPSFLDLLQGLDDIIDYFYMVDSFGGILQQDVIEIIEMVKAKTNIALGFHGHNNLEMALINTITAIDHGCEIVDATITGMGRGAGNLRTELYLTYLNSVGKLNFNYNQLSNVVSQFEGLKKHYEWGTNISYMFSGAFSLPQKQVMDWIGMNRYPLSTIINALNNSKDSVDDNIKLPEFTKKDSFKAAIIVGGGDSVKQNYRSIEEFINKNYNTCIIHAGVKHVDRFSDFTNKQFCSLVGLESEKLSKTITNKNSLPYTFIFPPFPRKMGTIIPDELLPYSEELSNIVFTENSHDSPLTISIQTALDLEVENIYLIGFDGYDKMLNQNQHQLTFENQNIFDDLKELKSINACFLTPTKYKNILIKSIYSYL